MKSLIFYLISKIKQIWFKFWSKKQAKNIKEAIIKKIIGKMLWINTELQNSDAIIVWKVPKPIFNSEEDWNVLRTLGNYWYSSNPYFSLYILLLAII